VNVSGRDGGMAGSDRDLMKVRHHVSDGIESFDARLLVRIHFKAAHIVVARIRSNERMNSSAAADKRLQAPTFPAMRRSQADPRALTRLVAGPVFVKRSTEADQRLSLAPRGLLVLYSRRGAVARLASGHADVNLSARL
jgi:hypothetical protein